MNTRRKSIDAFATLLNTVFQMPFDIDPEWCIDTIIGTVTRGSHKPVSARLRATERLRGYPAEEVLYVIRIVNHASERTRF